MKEWKLEAHNSFIETAILQGKKWWKYMVQTVDTVVVIS